MRQSPRCPRYVHALLLCLIYAPLTQAASLIWDITPGTVGNQDGSGTWSVGGANWFNSTTSTANQNFANGDSVTFGAAGGAAGTVTVSGTVVTPSITFNPATSGAYTVTGGTITLGGGTITANANATLSSILAGTGAVTKLGTAMLTLGGNSPNTFTGPFNVNAGIVVLNKPANSDSQLPQAIAGNVTVNIGDGTTQAIVRLDRSNQINDTGTVLNFSGTGATAGIFRLNSFSDTVGTIRSTGGAGIIENGHGSTVSTLTVNNTVTDTFSGILQNGGAAALNFAKVNTGTLTLTGVNTYTGTTTVRNGTLELTGTGSIANSSGYLLHTAGTLKLTNTSAANSANRLNDAAPVSLMGGTLALADDGSAAAYAETIGATTVAAGASTLSTVSSTTGSTTLTLNSLSRQKGATLNFTGTNLGESAQNRIVITGGPASTDNGLIGGWATVGNEFAKYDSANGITALTAADYATGAENTWSFESNAKFTSNVTLAANRRVNSLNFAASGVSALALGGNTLRVESGGVLVSGTSATSISGGTLTGGTSSDSIGEIIVHQNASAALDISATIADNGTRATSLVKSGTGTLKLSGANTFTGGLYINAGTLQIGNAAALVSNGAVALEGGTLDLNGFDTTIGALSSQLLNTTGLITNTVTGVKTLTVGNGGESSSFSGQLGANLNFTKTGNGTLFFNQSNAAYTGVITVAQGTLVTGNPTSLGAATGASDKTVILAGATLDISGGFNRNERIDIAGHGVNGQGAIILNSGDSQNIQFATLTGHTTLGVNIRYDFDNQLAGGGFNLTKTGAAELALEGGQVQNLGDIHIKQGTITWSGAADLGVASNTLYVDAGNIAQYYNKNNDSKQVVLSGGTLRRSGTATGSAGQILDVAGGLTLTAGASSVAHSQSQLVFQLNTINRSLGATLNVDNNATLATTDTLNTNGIIGGYATVGGNTWAVSAGTGTDVFITGLATYNTNDFTNAANNVDVTIAAPTVPADFTVNSVRFNTATPAVVTLSGINTVSSGGILVTSTVGNNLTRITGGTLRGSAGGDLIVIQNNGSNGLTIESVIANNTTATALTKAGAGTLTLAGNNTYSGGTFFSGGIVAISKLADTGDSNLGNSTGGTDNMWTFNTGRLQLVTGATADVTTARDILLMSGGGVIDVVNAARTVTLNGVIGSEALLNGEGISLNSSVLTKEGSGTLTLGGTAANTSIGVTLINAGTLRLNKTAGVDAIAGNITLGNNTGGLDVLLLGASNQIKDTSVLTINGTTANAGIFRLNGQSDTIGGLTSGAAGTGIVENESGAANTGTLDVSVAANTTYTFSGILRNGDGTGTDGTLAFTKSGDGTQILTGTNTYTGDTTVSDGTLQLGNGSTTGAISGSSRVVLNGGALSVNRSNAYAMTNAMTGNGTFIQAGTGVTTLSSNTSDYSGITEVRAGTLLVTNTSGSATGTSTVFVNGGTLAGTGIIAGATTVRESGRLAPGDASVNNGIGKLTFGGDLTLKRTASATIPLLTLQVGTINDALFNDAAGISANLGNLTAYLTSQLATYENESGIHDRLTIGGTFHLEAGALIAVDNSLGRTFQFGDVLDLFDWANLDVNAANGDRSWSTDLDLLLPTLGSGLSYDYSLFAGSGIIVVVPEPGRMALLMIAVMGLLMRRRRC